MPTSNDSLLLTASEVETLILGIFHKGDAVRKFPTAGVLLQHIGEASSKYMHIADFRV